MLVLRILVLLAVLFIGGSALAWAFTGERRYLRFGWRIFQVTLAALLAFLALLFFERLLFTA